MNTTEIKVSYACKFNDPQKRYMNHNFGAEATAALAPGEDPEQARQKLASEVETFVHSRRTQIYRAAELEEEFKSQKRDFQYAVEAVNRYEEGTRQARDKMKEANGFYAKLESLRGELGKLGVIVELPKPCIDLPAAPQIEATADPEEDGNDPDEEADEQASID